MVRRSVTALVALAGGMMLLASIGGAQVTSCSGANCAEVSVVGGEGSPGGTADISVRFRQAPADAQPGSGNDDIAAIALTIGLGPSGTPLSLADCDDDDLDGFPDAITPGGDIVDDFRLVIENVECPAPSSEQRACGCKDGINRCLCPGSGQTRDNFVNAVVYGPKEIPTEGVTIPRLPNNAELLELTLRIAGGTTETSVPVTIFAEADSAPKPTFGAFLSIGDQAAVDQTAQAGTSRITVTNGAVSIVPGECVGDCNDDGEVVVNELVLGVELVMSSGDPSSCQGLDLGGNGSVEVDELLNAVDDALNGCQ